MILFTIAQINAAHSKVRSGADFPAYIQELKKLGVHRYETFVTDGRTIYFHQSHGYKVSSAAKYEALEIAATSDVEQFKADLKAHQQGKTDYPTFCRDCARSGIEKWVVSIGSMTCTYYDKGRNEVLVEEIPK